MSHIENTRWLEAAQDSFEEAIERGNLVAAKDIIADTFDAGFPTEARSMNEQLRNTPVSKFAIKSTYPNL